MSGHNLLSDYKTSIAPIVKIMSVLVTLMLTLNLSGQNIVTNNPKIEIYFLKESEKLFSTQPRSNYFNPTSEELSDTAFIKNEEIEGYRVYEDSLYPKSGKLYSLIISTSGQQKINALKNIPLCCGKKFVVVLNNQPVFGAYFWNLVSSFGCTWLTTFAYCNDELILLKGLPNNYFDKTKEDPRGNVDLIEAFRSTGRLIAK